jgi:hypothetical protein
MAEDDDDPEVHRAALALYVAVLDGACDERAHELLCRADDPHFAVTVAHHLAHKFVDSIDAEDHDEMREDLAAELHRLAG